MSKAEKFIQDCTKNCSNQYNFPEYFENGIKRLKEYQSWLTPDQARNAVEIAREEIFEKIKFYIKSMVNDIAFLDTEGNDSYNLDKFIDDLKQAMKDE